MKSNKRTIQPAKLILSFCALITLVAAFWADAIGPFAKEHLSNPLWPPHAKFHDAQYICMSALLSLIALYMIWSRNSEKSGNLITASLILTTPWLSMYGALLFPGTAMFDPEYDKPSAYIAGLHPQIWFSTLIIFIISVIIMHLLRRDR